MTTRNPANPRPYATDVASETTRSGLSGRRVIHVVLSDYPNDARVRRAAEAMAAEGMRVEVLCRKRFEHERAREDIDGIGVRRFSLRHHRGGILGYFLQYSVFILYCFATITWRSLFRRYAVVHVHNMPDILVFCAVVPRILGARVILDLHDPMPELMSSIYALAPGSLAVRAIRHMERLSIAFATAIVTVNRRCKKIVSERGCSPEKISVVMNASDACVFPFRPLPARPVLERDPEKPFVVMYHGALVERHGLDLAVEAVEGIRASIPNARLRIYGDSNAFLEKILHDVGKRGQDVWVEYLGAGSLEDIAAAIEKCDVGVIPNRRSIFTELNTPTRIFEFLNLGRPVIAPRAPGSQDYFAENELIYFELGDVEDLADKLIYVYSNPGEVRETVRRGQRVCEEHGWEKERSVLIDLVYRQLNAGKASAWS